MVWPGWVGPPNHPPPPPLDNHIPAPTAGGGGGFQSGYMPLVPVGPQGQELPPTPTGHTKLEFVGSFEEWRLPFKTKKI